MHIQIIINSPSSDSPRWTFYAKNVDGLEVRNCEIEARRSDADNHNVVDMTAFNTDGFDVTGRNVWIHDCAIWNQVRTYVQILQPCQTRMRIANLQDWYTRYDI